MTKDITKKEIKKLFGDTPIGNKKKATTTHNNTSNSCGTVINGGTNVIHNKSPDQLYKFDDSAAKIGRTNIGFRQINEAVDPIHMTRKEFEHFLCYKFNFNLGKGWDGIEKYSFQPNWTPDYSHNIETIEEALDFLGVKANKKSPDGIEKRQISERRKKQQDIRKNKVERRTRYQRKIDKKNEIKHTIQYMVTVVIWVVIYITLWGIAK